MIRRFWLVLLLGLSACEVHTSSKSRTSAEPAQAGESTGLDIRAARLSGPEDAAFSLMNYRGKVLLLNFLSLDSAPCRAQWEVLKQVAPAWEGRPFALVGMVTDIGAPDVLAAKASELDTSFSTALADDNVRAAFGGIRAVPSIVWVDRKGQIRKTLGGFVSADEIQSEVNALLAEP